MEELVEFEAIALEEVDVFIEVDNECLFVCLMVFDQTFVFESVWFNFF